ncbi:MAG: hypothetical protein FWG07_07745 [Treponema sp.]|nr:hypothetical protein [Treponema sp.]
MENKNKVIEFVKTGAKVVGLGVLLGMAVPGCDNGSTSSGGTEVTPEEIVDFNTRVTDITYARSEVEGKNPNQIAWGKMAQLEAQSKIIAKQYALWEQELRTLPPTADTAKQIAFAQYVQSQQASYQYSCRTSTASGLLNTNLYNGFVNLKTNLIPSGEQAKFEGMFSVFRTAHHLNQREEYFNPSVKATDESGMNTACNNLISEGGPTIPVPQRTHESVSAAIPTINTMFRDALEMGISSGKPIMLDNLVQQIEDHTQFWAWKDDIYDRWGMILNTPQPPRMVTPRTAEATTLTR